MPDQEGLQFPHATVNKRSTTQTGQAIFSAALEKVHPQAAQALRDERQWRKRYPQHIRALTEVALLRPENALHVAEAGLAEAWRQFEFIRDGQVLSLTEAMQHPQPQTWRTIELEGQGSREIEPWTVPYHGQQLQGEALRKRIAQWEQGGIVEPSHAQALRRLLDHPEWFDLSDRTVVLLGAASEAGPLAALAKWRANIVALDLPRPALWQKIAQTIQHGNARLIAPLSQAIPPGAMVKQGIESAGANLLTQTPEIAAWLKTLATPLDIAALAYLDGEKHVRVSLAMDAIMSTVSAAQPNTSLMVMMTPTDVFAVPEATAQAAMRHYAERSPVRQAAAAPVRSLSGGRLLLPHLEGLIESSNGKRYGIVDCLVIEQGPNYALAKRLQQWRALTARAHGQRVALNVAPATLTQSVIKNPALKAGYDAAHLFGIEVFEPETTNALMAALWVHDLRCNDCAANPAYPLSHPLELLMEGANHGGLWQSGYLPRSALPLAALVGFVRGRAARKSH